MSRFCTYCGNPLNENALFCSSCGKRGVSVVIHPPKKAFPKWLIITVSAVVAVCFFSVIGFGVWKAGEMTGFWNERALNKASQDWKKQPGYKTEEKAINSVLSDLEQSISAGDIPEALSVFHEDVRDDISLLLYSNQGNLYILSDALKTIQITFLSADSGYYDESLLATVTAGVPSVADPAVGEIFITMIKTDQGWVVYKLQ